MNNYLLTLQMEDWHGPTGVQPISSQWTYNELIAIFKTRLRCIRPKEPTLSRSPQCLHAMHFNLANTKLVTLWMTKNLLLFFLHKMATSCHLNIYIYI